MLELSLEVVEELRLLGIIVRSDMKGSSNTENMTKKANKNLWILRRLKYLGAEEGDIVVVAVLMLSIHVVYTKPGMVQSHRKKELI